MVCWPVSEEWVYNRNSASYPGGPAFLASVEYVPLVVDKFYVYDGILVGECLIASAFDPVCVSSDFAREVVSSSPSDYTKFVYDSCVCGRQLDFSLFGSLTCVMSPVKCLLPAKEQWLI